MTDTVQGYAGRESTFEDVVKENRLGSPETAVEAMTKAAQPESEMAVKVSGFERFPGASLPKDALYGNNGPSIS